MKVWKIATLVLAAATLIGNAQAQSAKGADPANPLITDRWQFRPLIVVTPDAQAPAYRDLRRQLAASQAQFDEREMLLYTVEGDQGTRHGVAMTPYETRALIEALGVDPSRGVTTILMGKDGGKKVELRGEVDLQQIYDTIDRMPMRRADG
ncbi:hypothetical protein GY26_19115 [Gammaproteobacteria bacterium MFB021]|nr:hypothetical protein GY26_19115 [Gammaproteobacteria bacterium MFB021]